MPKVQQGVNDLYTWCLNNGEFGQQILNEWTDLDENNQPVSIDSVARASGKKVKWRCSRGHEWVAAIESRTGKKRGCPYCNKRGIKGRPQGQISLLHWCLTHGEFGRQLIDEWAYSKSEMDLIPYGSSTEAVWKCRKGHTWKTPISYRTSNLSGCPYCSGKRVSEQNSLKTWCLNNGVFGQQLIDQWEALDENNQQISIDDIPYGSARKVKWRCSKGHEWIASIHKRTSHKSGCPYCTGKGAPEENSLKSWVLNNGELGQQLLREWVGLDENDQPISIDNVTKASDKKVKWKCSNGHTWIATIHNRTVHKTGCPYCHRIIQSHRRIPNSENSLKTWCLNNGAFGQQLLNEWTGLDENNQTISIDNVAKASAKRVKWKCSQGHEWYAPICQRTVHKTGCPYCPRRIQSHRRIQNSENNLKTWCLNNGEFGQQLLREWIGLDENNQPISIDSVTRASSKKVQWKCSNEHTWCTTIGHRTVHKTGCPYCSGKMVSDQNSLKVWCLNNGAFGQQLLNEWTGLDENNQPISMDSVSYASTKRVKWRCSRGHEWFAIINNRTANRTGCPYCAGRKNKEQ